MDHAKNYVRPGRVFPVPAAGSGSRLITLRVFRCCPEPKIQRSHRHQPLGCAADAATTSWWPPSQIRDSRSFRQGPPRNSASASAPQRRKEFQGRCSPTPRSIRGDSRRRWPAGTEPLFQGRVASLPTGRLLQVSRTSSSPKPFQKKLPIYVSGKSCWNLLRARRCWKVAETLAAGRHAWSDRIRAGVKSLREQADKAGRRKPWSRSRSCPQFVPSHLGKDAEAAIESFRRARETSHGPRPVEVRR